MALEVIELGMLGMALEVIELGVLGMEELADCRLDKQLYRAPWSR
jgi:hypothetical protein